MYTTTILFSLLVTLVNNRVGAAPLPMPAARMSAKLASRFYDFPIGTSCLTNGQQGVLEGDICVLLTSDVPPPSGGLLGGPSRLPFPAAGAPCTLNGRQGVWQDALCVLADVDINAKRNLLGLGGESFNPGDTCYVNNRVGLWRDGLCNLLDLNLDVTSGDSYPVGSIVPTNGGAVPLAPLLSGPAPVPAPAFGGAPCWLNGRRGYWQDDICVLADLQAAKRSTILDGSDGLVGGLVETLTNDRPAPPHRGYPLGSPHLLSADATALVNVVPTTHRFYARNSLFDHSPSDNVVAGATKSVSQLLDHVHVVERDLPDLSHPYKTAQGDLLAQAEAAVDVDGDVVGADRSYHGPNGLKIVPLTHSLPLGVAKKDLLSAPSLDGGLLGLGTQAHPHASQPNRLFPHHRSNELPLPLKRELGLGGLTGASSSSPSKGLLGPLTGATSTSNTNSIANADSLPVVGDILKTDAHKQGGIATLL